MAKDKPPCVSFFPLQGKIIVVIDALRAISTIITAPSNGTRAVIHRVG